MKMQAGSANRTLTVHRPCPTTGREQARAKLLTPKVWRETHTRVHACKHARIAHTFTGALKAKKERGVGGGGHSDLELKRGSLSLLVSALGSKQLHEVIRIHAEKEGNLYHGGVDKGEEGA